MKANLEFNLPDDEFEFKCASEAMKLRIAIQEIYSILRGRTKYGISEEEQSFSPYQMVEKIREEIWDVVSENNLKWVFD